LPGVARTNSAMNATLMKNAAPILAEQLSLRDIGT
jgi:hypothetical protein